MVTVKKIAIGLSFCASIFLAHAESIFIIIHGTWGADYSWHGPQGDFFDALTDTVNQKGSTVLQFRWSGGIGHAARVQAAHNLIKLIKTYDVTTAIFLVAHSHGGNVGTLASQFLAQEPDNKHTIRALFTLGTPIMSSYLPNMNIIHYLYNLFSLEDLIQPVLGISSRTYPRHKRIANLRLFINNKEPDHSGMHDPLIGTWLAHIHRHFKRYLQEQGIFCSISEPTIMYLDHSKAPQFASDIKRNELLDRDHQLSVLMVNSLRNSLDTGSSIPLTNL